MIAFGPSIKTETDQASICQPCRPSCHPESRACEGCVVQEHILLYGNLNPRVFGYRASTDVRGCANSDARRCPSSSTLLATGLAIDLHSNGSSRDSRLCVLKVCKPMHYIIQNHESKLLISLDAIGARYSPLATSCSC